LGSGKNRSDYGLSAVLPAKVHSRHPAEGLTRIRADTGGKRERFTDGEIEKTFAVIPEIYPNEAKAARVRAFLLTLQ
jgi:hypothetical protein